MNKIDDGTYEIDLLKIASGLLRHAVMIILVTCVCTCAGYFYSKLCITPRYKADIKLYVNNNTLDIGDSLSSISSSGLTASRSLVDTYIVLLESRTTLNEVIQKADLDMTTSELSSLISAESIDETEVLQISVTTTDPKESRLIANTIAKVLPDRIDEIIEGSSARIVDYAVKPLKKCYPTNTKFGLYGMLIGLFISCGYVVIRILVDDSIKSEEDLITSFEDIPVLAVIPNLSKAATAGSKYKKREDGSYYYYAYKKKK